MNGSCSSQTAAPRRIGACLREARVSSGFSAKSGGRFVDRPSTSGSDDPPILRWNNVGAVSRSRKHRRRLFIHGEDRFPTNDQQGFHSPRLSGSTPGLPKIERKREDNIVTGSTGRVRALRTRSSVWVPVGLEATPQHAKALPSPRLYQAFIGR
jgi:hypothetical protein